LPLEQHHKIGKKEKEKKKKEENQRFQPWFFFSLLSSRLTGNHGQEE
jgi:hypothetical protein